ncbi:hypothetical protein B0A48_18748 [Cryoendolithus antarcticus]|uniref:PiggyBac transposable element-derived protein domain-containing protein n=1 Tax=Cryoendolithus antarcticus TaxID=1507870 RepID=A0A1V8S8H2_9PEZI|nr:hypothetical protein B0A48_18748 [Cryoendolithus antarcticus]
MLRNILSSISEKTGIPMAQLSQILDPEPLDPDQGSIKRAVDLTSNVGATSRVFPSISTTEEAEYLSISIIKAVLETLDSEPIDEMQDIDEHGDGETICDQNYILKNVWTINHIQGMRMRDKEVHWCIGLQDQTIGTEWFKRSIACGQKLQEYASHTFDLQVGSTYVKWYPQWFMGLTRFEQIKRFFHVSPPLDSLPQSQFYQKLEPLSTEVITAFKSACLPASQVAIDEMIIPFTGRSKHTIMMKGKPVPVGYNILALLDYNDFMRAVDIHDQYKSYNSTQLIGLRVWLPLFFFILDAVVTNAFIMYKALYQHLKDKFLHNQRRFRLRLAWSLVLEGSHAINTSWPDKTLQPTALSKDIRTDTGQFLPGFSAIAKN